ncbi:MAG TPA: hypothetical protein VMA73_23980 [Streptosporangiaceae bacterium]|nr:hypothetical protein [Streptosporangiaceae bacterium]
MKLTEAEARREIAALNAKFITITPRSLIMWTLILGFLIGARYGGLT